MGVKRNWLAKYEAGEYLSINVRRITKVLSTKVLGCAITLTRRKKDTVFDQISRCTRTFDVKYKSYIISFVSLFCKAP